MFEKFEVFSKKDLGSVRTVLNLETGEPWFVAKDVCDCLGIKNSRDALTKLDADEKNTVVLTDGIHARRGNPNVAVVNESGLYLLIMRSRKKAAEDFQRWVTREVLPSIRKNGGYILGQEDLPDKEREDLLEKVKELSKENEYSKNDANHWYEMYNILLNEIAEAKIEHPDATIVAKTDVAKSLANDSTYVDKNLFVHEVKKSKYQILELEER